MSYNKFVRYIHSIQWWLWLDWDWFFINFKQKKQNVNLHPKGIICSLTNEWNLRCKYFYYGNETKYTNEYKDKNLFKFNIPALLRFVSSFDLKDDLMIPLLRGYPLF